MASISTFLRSELESPKTNLIAGLTVSVVALPLALAFGAASGLGPASGIITAIIAGAIAAIFGGSRFQVSGPTGAMTVILLPVFSSFGANGVLTTGLLAGCLLVVAGLSRLGRHVHRIPTAIIEGFTAGIAVVIALQQLPNALAVTVQRPHQIWANAYWSLQNLNRVSPHAILIALLTFALILIGERYFKRAPLALLALLLSTVLSAVFSDLPRIGQLPSILKLPSVDFLTGQHLLTLAPSALAVAALAALESLLSAKVADRLAKASIRHDSDRELLGQGLANIAAPLFGGVPATAALARTAVNVRAGATSRLAAFSHAIFLVLIVLATPTLVAQIPLAALAGVLFATTYRMIKIGELVELAKESTLDAVLLITTFAMTIAFDLITAVLIGLILFLVLRKTRLAQVDRRYPPVDSKDRLGD